MRWIAVWMLGGALAMTGSALVGCGRVMTPAELEEHETRTFPGRSRAELVTAATLALRTLGYTVTLADRASGRVKTSPHVVQVSAVGSAYHAVALENALSWTVDVTTNNDGAIVHAVPRAYTNGQPLEDQRFSADYMERAFAELYREIESDLPRSDSRPSRVARH